MRTVFTVVKCPHKDYKKVIPVNFDLVGKMFDPHEENSFINHTKSFFENVKKNVSVMRVRGYIISYNIQFVKNITSMGNETIKHGNQCVYVCLQHFRGTCIEVNVFSLFNRFSVLYFFYSLQNKRSQNFMNHFLRLFKGHLFYYLSLIYILTYTRRYY